MKEAVLLKYTQKTCTELEREDNSKLYELIERLAIRRNGHKAMRSYKGVSYDMVKYRDLWIAQLTQVISYLLFGILANRFYTIEKI